MTSLLGRRQFLRDSTQAAALAALVATAPTSLAAPRRSPRTKAELEECAGRLEALGKDYLGVAPAEGRLLQQLTRLARSERVLEIGTCFGLASVWLGLALEETGGSLVSLELLPERVEQARRHVESFGLSRRVNIIAGNAHALVPTLKRRFDFVFLNADRAGNVDYFQKLHPDRLSSRAGLLAAHVVREPDKLKAYVDTVSAHPGYDSAVITAGVDDGFLLSVRRGT